MHQTAKCLVEVKGSYFAEYLYEIEVKEREVERRIGSPGFRLARNDVQKYLSNCRKVVRGEIGPASAKKIAEASGVDVVKNIKDFNDEVKRKQNNRSRS